MKKDENDGTNDDNRLRKRKRSDITNGGDEGSEVKRLNADGDAAPITAAE